MWRKQIRAKSRSVHRAILGEDERTVRRLRAEFRLLLNPLDPSDHHIVKSIRLAEGSETPECIACTFITQVELLLKHDWERAKLEAGWFLPRWFLEAKRHTPAEAKERRGESKLRRRDRYKLRPGSVALGIAAALLVILVVGIGMWQLDLGHFTARLT